MRGKHPRASGAWSPHGPVGRALPVWRRRMCAALVTGDLAVLVAELLALARAELGPVPCAVLLVNHARGYVEVADSHGFRPDRSQGCRIPFGAGITGTVATTGQEVFVPDVRGEARYIPGTEGAEWELAVPVRDGAEVLAVVDVEGAGPPPSVAQRSRLTRLVQVFGPAFRLLLQIRSLQQAALTDDLTGLGNYRFLRRALARHVAETPQRRLSLVLVDVDRFKQVNDAFGHLAGDQVLVRVAGVIQDVVTGLGEAARHGGDEFALILPDMAAAEAAAVAARLRERLQRLPCLHAPGGTLTVSTGVATYPDEARDWEELLHRADHAMYAAKPRSVPRHRPPAAPSPKLAPPPEHLARLLARQALYTVYQPIRHLETGRVLGWEALCRGGEGLGIGPADLFRLALDDQVVARLEEGCLTAALTGGWETAHTTGRLFLNVHPRSLARPEFGPALAELLSRHNVPFHRTVLEITEHSPAAGNLPERIRALLALMPGLQVAIDDFGSGYANVASVIETRPSYIKIARELVSHLEDDRGKRTFIESLGIYAAHMNLVLIAEGVETVQQARILQQLGVQWAQGWYLGYPVPHPRDADLPPLESRAPHREALAGSAGLPSSP